MINIKYKKLREILKDMDNVVVAYSGGVDSAFLLKVAVDVLGDNVYGVLAVSPTYPMRELEQAKSFAASINARIKIIETHELENPEFKKNPANRCYYCKNELFTQIAFTSKELKISNLVDGSNADDLQDYRPGLKALRELGVRSPLQEAGLTKYEIRELSKELGLSTWDKEAMACLSSRFAYGETIEIKSLRMIDEMENYLYDIGFHYVRARYNNKTLKIEVSSQDVNRFFENEVRLNVIEKAKLIGFAIVTVDLEGYRQGSMNENLSVAVNQPK